MSRCDRASEFVLPLENCDWEGEEGERPGGVSGKDRVRKAVRSRDDG